LLKTITIGQYLPGDSLVHRLDPRVKILVAFAYVILLFFVRSAPGYALMAGFTALAIAISRLPPRMVLRGLRPIILIVVLTVVLNFFMTPGRVVYALGPLSVTDQGIRQGLLLAVRLVLLILTTSLLTLTTSPIDLTDGIERLLNPFRRIGVPAHELAMMMTIALRFIPTLVEETDKIMKAQMARGADFAGGGLIQRARNLVPLLVPLFVSAFRRADELALAMEARCYRGGQGRSRYKVLRLEATDYAAALVSLVIMTAAVLLP